MEAVNLSQVSQTSFGKKQKVQKEVQKTPGQKKNGKKLLIAGACAVAAIVVAGLAIKKGKLPKATQVVDLKFDKGIAMKGDELFTGIAEHVNKKGDKFLLEYEDGQLLKSSKNIDLKTGAGNIEKGNFVKTYIKYGDTLHIRKSEDTINGVQESICSIDEENIEIIDASKKIRKTSLINKQPRKQVLPDGTEKYWYRNGQKNAEKLPDGTSKVWHENGKLRYEKLPDGTVKEWHENGQKSFEKLPDGTSKRWHENGQKSFEILPDGTSKRWHENGKLRYEKLPDSTEREWHANGQKSFEILPDGTLKGWHENGQMQFEILPDGTKRRWYENGQMQFEILPDGTENHWRENGQIIRNMI